MPDTTSVNSLRLALGTVQFGLPYGVSNKLGQVSLQTAGDIVRFAANSGVDTIDTAIGYGESEQVLGNIGVRGFNVVSKLLPLPEFVLDVEMWALREAEASIKRLRIDGFYGLLLHRSSDLHEARGAALYEAMQKLKSEGFVRKVGISIYSPEELDSCFKKFDFDLVQAPFNLLDHRLYSSGWLDRLKAKGCEVHVRSVFLQGLLLMSLNDIPPKFRQWSGIWNDWHQWLLRYNIDAVSSSLAYPLSFQQIDRVIVGVNDLEQMRQIVTAVTRSVEHQLPNLACDNEYLINPAKWTHL